MAPFAKSADMRAPSVEDSQECLSAMHEHAGLGACHFISPHIKDGWSQTVLRLTEGWNAHVFLPFRKQHCTERNTPMVASSQTGEGSLRDELSSDASTLGNSAKQKLHSELDSRKGEAATQAETLSSALASAANELSGSPSWLRSAFEQGARTLHRFAETIEHKDSRQLTREVQQMAREHPATFLAGCAMAGFVGARVLKAGAEDTNGSSSGSYEPYGSSRRAQDEQSGSAFTGMDATQSQRVDGQPVNQVQS
jgi:hypothetical protein